MWKRGEIAGYQLASGTVIVNQPAQESRVTRKAAIYARVSNSENKKNLDTQAERLVAWCRSQGWSVVQIVKECGSGVNDQQRELVVVNSASTAEEDLMSDLVSIITSFVARLYGRRRAKRKTDQVLAALQENGSNGEQETSTTT